MDADRFDALSRALTAPGSRRTTLGVLLGTLLASALPGAPWETLAAAGKGKGKRRLAAKNDRHPSRGTLAKSRRTRLGQDRHQPFSQYAMDELTPEPAGAVRLESHAVRAGDVSAASCLPPGAKPCREHSECCSGRCKRKKKKCLPCAKGTEYCASQQACVAPGACVVTCATGTADCNGDGTCETNTNTSTQHCGGCNKPCETNQTCVNSVCTGGTTCSPSPCPGDKVCNASTGFCACPANTMQCEFNTSLCSSDLNTDVKRCGLSCENCLNRGAGYHCCSGRCANGCGPSSYGSCADEPCGSSCQPCTGGKACCNLGPNTTGQCVDLVAGFCPSLATP